jgi:hypothetical protein
MAKQKRQAQEPTVLDRLNDWVDTHRGLVLILIGGVTLLYSLLLFNARISEGNDDSLYVEAGYRYAHDLRNYWYSANAPGYPIFLSLPIRLFGLNIILLKVISALFYLCAAVLTWITLSRHIRPMVLLPVMFIMAVNAYGQYFASQTYTEAFFLFVQAIFLWCFFRLMEDGRAITDLRRSWGRWLMLGLMLTLMGVVKNVAIVAVPAVIAFFLFTKQWKAAGLSVATFVVFMLGWAGLRNAIWQPAFAAMKAGGASGGQFSAQGQLMLQKDPYDVTKGYEDTAGMITRFFDNITIYMGKRFWEIIGVLKKDPVMSAETKGNYTFLALVLIALLVWALIGIIRRKDRALLFLWLYAASVCAGSFIALHVRWDQPRVILVMVPLLLIFVLNALFNLVSKHGTGARIYTGLAGLLIVLSLWRSTVQAGDNLPILQENLKGDAYAGYTPDWVNFLKMSRWCADNLPEDAVIVSRKAPMSFVYGKGRTFFPIYKVVAMDPKTKQSNPDSVMALFQREHVTHVMIASLRLQTNVNNGRIVNTIHNVMQPFVKKFPNKVRLVHQEGKSEPTYLYAITP